MITPIQVIAVLFALWALSRVFLRLRDSNLSTREFIFWTFLWVFVIIVAFVPDLTTELALKLGIERGMNLLFSLSIIVIFYLIFRLYIKVENTSQEITKVVRQIAIENKKKKK